MIEVDVSPFEEAHAALQVELEARAFANVAESARPKDSAAYLDHVHGAKNPAGRAWIAVAREDDRAVGSAAALPARFARKDGRILIGWQVGTFVVDAAQQRKGIGTALLAALSGALKDRPDSFLYSYPNRRSIPVFERHGYSRKGRTPTRIFLPARGPGKAWEIRRIPRAEVPKLLASLPAPARPPDGFVRDARYFEWRFASAEAENRYRFVHCREKDGPSAFVIALAAHRFAGQSFGVLADAYPDVLDAHMATAVRASLAEGRKDGSRFLYATATIRDGSRAPWSVAVPESRDPRPVVLVVHDETKVVAPEEIAASRVMTADWGGF